MNPESFQLSPGRYLAPAVDWLNTNFHPFFDGLARLIEAVLGGIETALLLLPPYGVIAAAAALAAAFIGVRVALVALLSLSFCWLVGFWTASMQ